MFRKNQNGSVLVATVLVGTVVAAVTAVILSAGLKRYQDAMGAVKIWHAKLANQKAATLGAYLITNSFIVCRQQAWPNGSHCRWAGEDRRQDTIDKPSHFNLENMSVKNGRLSFDTKIAADEFVSVNTKVSFELVKWGDNPDLIEMVGFIPNKNAPADDDMYIISIQTDSEYVNASGNLANLRYMGGMRRPLGLVSIDVEGNPQCLLACAVPAGENGNPECRGPQEQPLISESQIKIRVRNEGPGPIYRLVLEKIIEYNKEYFDLPDKRLPLDVMRGKSIFMPGDEIVLTDVIECIAPRTVVRSRRVRGRRNSTRTVINTHYEDYSNMFYGVSVSRFDPENPSPRTKVKDINKWLEATYNPREPATYRKNPTTSVLEPKKVATNIEKLGNITAQRKIVTRTIIRTVVVPTH